ncbi:MAG: hypothetical protein IKP60_00855 [Treponema sp.]|nr:hypothetical protein [Treponema sp.]
MVVDILTAAQSFSKLLDVEYQIILGKKKNLECLSISFEKQHFYHLAGLHYLRDLADIFSGDRALVFEKILSETISQRHIELSRHFSKITDRIEYLSYLEQIMDSNETVFKYNSRLDVFSAVQADFLMKNEIQTRNVFTFLSQNASTGKYFCRSFFPQTDRDYTEGQTRWTLLYKKKLWKSTGQENVLYDRMRR